MQSTTAREKIDIRKKNIKMVVTIILSNAMTIADTTTL